MKSQGFMTVILLVGLALPAAAQSGAGGAQYPKPTPDSNIIFHSPRPLVENLQARSYREAWGLDVLFSNYGFGGGIFFRHEFANDLCAFAILDVTGIKNANEITLYDPYTGTYIQPENKINNVYVAPLTFGVQYRIFSEVIAESFRPYINAGAGPAMIVAAPSALDFFGGFKHATVTFVPDLFVGLGANIGRDKRTVTGVNLRYYYIPVKKGVESIQGAPLYDLGGFFITLNWGLTF